MQLNNFKKIGIMKKNFVTLSLIFSVLVLSVVSCKQKDPTPDPDPEPVINVVSPDPEPGGILPSEVLPDSLVGVVSQYFTIYSGENPVLIEDEHFAVAGGQFVSSPHALLYSTLEDDTVEFFNDRCVAFFKNHEYVDFYGQQWDDEYNANYSEAIRKLNIVGEDDNFTCYYFTDGYPHGVYLKMSTIFSGRWNESYGGLKDFQVAVIMLENSGDDAVAPAGTIRVLGDFDGLAQDTDWMSGKRVPFNNEITVKDPFSIFRIK